MHKHMCVHALQKGYKISIPGQHNEAQESNVAASHKFRGPRFFAM